MASYQQHGLQQQNEGIRSMIGANSFAVNNAAFACGTPLGGTGSGWVRTNNITGNADAAALAFDCLTFGDAEFLYPSASCPLIGAVSASYAPGIDFNFTPRPQGGAPDAGAYERTTAANPGSRPS